ncbi:MAG TPA: hypothetical protein VIO11_08855, partial [Candidatus Methanoperedens sp.]
FLCAQGWAVGWRDTDYTDSTDGHGFVINCANPCFPFMFFSEIKKIISYTLKELNCKITKIYDCFFM